MDPRLAATQAPDVDRGVEAGEAAFARGELRAARAHFESALELQPDSARARQNLGVVHCELGELSLARRELEAAVLRDPGYAVARINLAHVLAALGDGPAALLQLAAADGGRDGESSLRAHAAELAALFDPGIVRFVAEAPFRGIAPELLCRVGELLGIAAAETPEEPSRDRTLRRHREIVAFLLCHHSPGASDVLDVGCHNGRLLRQLHRAGFARLQGCDLKAGIRSGELPGLTVRELDINACGLEPYAAQSFDLLVCSDVLEHLESPALALREMARVMRPQAELFLSIPNAFNRFERLEILRTGNSTRYARSAPQAHGHISMLPLQVLQSLCDRAGLAIVEEGSGYCFLFGRFWFPDRTFAHSDSYVCTYRIRKK